MLPAGHDFHLLREEGKRLNAASRYDITNNNTRTTDDKEVMVEEIISEIIAPLALPSTILVWR